MKCKGQRSLDRPDVVKITIVVESDCDKATQTILNRLGQLAVHDTSHFFPISPLEPKPCGCDG